ncbi:leucyl-tRNA synthetase [Methylacidimicrobium cyclopophantes]|uniref:Leucine--tRNA ligase n=1 Tax=Methylacidimicrobium cyclopophantes TaxID=1041766 RepID=A0A5E6MK88_9BACT|nr:leucine--tRNA ligase [Methylacidimicrobium cyclopophantes]VVM08506.1 leucyl-tRNA synthetase [Methylacidimicrobium cyclopophantes]
MEARRAYPFDRIEPKWQRIWRERRVFRAANPGEPGAQKPKYYVLDMFPYPSGRGLHVGHLEGYTASDIVARYKRMRGFNVLHPMGWDAFGLPAEQHAIATGIHPRITTERNIANFRAQIEAMGFSYDWSREIKTTDPGYYRWTQWIFLQLFRRGLAYVAEAPVWYCPALQTVLANEEILPSPEGPVSERGHHPVERRPLRQWMLRITAYAERLLADLDLVEWPESIKEMQRNWIGRSEGAAIRFPIEGKDVSVEVFTTRPDTLFGATYLVLAPEHPLVSEITRPECRTAVEAYQQEVAKKSDLERSELSGGKTGVSLGSFAINPASRERIPVWIADYVLMSYGTGAIMAVPAHDERDYEFATLFGLPVRSVVRPADSSDPPARCFSGEGIACSSRFLDGLPTREAKKAMIAWLEEKGVGKRTVQYRLRDWLFSRQRYWGEPFPIIWRNGKAEAVPETELPVLLPERKEFSPEKGGFAPLSQEKSWVELPDGGRRETNTMPQWAGSCWYYLRYLDPANGQALVSPVAERYWMGPQGVDLYIGGAEHAVLHLLYARFWHKFLYDIGVVSTPEPFHRLVNQGIILGEDGRKMSKSFGNIVNPDGLLREYGADTVRLFEMFLGPLEQMKPWSSQGLEGPHRFLARVWRLVMEEDAEGRWTPRPGLSTEEAPLEVRRILHQTIRKVTDDLEQLSFHTAIAQMMILVNALTRQLVQWRCVLEPLILLLSPFAPHLCEELWSALGQTDSLAYARWPEADPRLLAEEEAEWVIQINGKVRGRMTAARSLGREEAEALARRRPEIEAWIEGKSVQKVVFVPGKLLNFVVGPS